jgi:hypothetical protein
MLVFVIISSSSNGLPFERLAHEEFRQPQSVAHFVYVIQGTRVEISTDVSNITPHVCDHTFENF